MRVEDERAYSPGLAINRYTGSANGRGVIDMLSRTLFANDLTVKRNGVLARAGTPAHALVEGVHDHVAACKVFENWYRWYKILGQSYLVIDEDNNGVPILVAPDPRKMVVVTSENERIVGFVYGPDSSKPVQISADRVAMLSDIPLAHHINCESLAQAGEWASKVNTTVLAQQYWHYKRGGMPPVMWRIDAAGNGVSARNMVDSFVRDRSESDPRVYYGIKGKTEVVAFAIPQTDTFGDKILSITAAELCALYGIPYELYIGRDGTHYEELERIMWRRVLLGDAKMIGQVLSAAFTRWLAKAAPRTAYSVAFDLRRVMALLLAEAAALDNAKSRLSVGLTTVNEERENFGMSPYTGEFAEFGRTPQGVATLDADADADDESETDDGDRQQ